MYGAMRSATPRFLHDAHHFVVHADGARQWIQVRQAVEHRHAQAAQAALAQ